MLDGLYGEEIAAFTKLFETRQNQGRATTDIAQAARAATYGAVETMLIDIDEVVGKRLLGQDDADLLTVGAGKEVVEFDHIGQVLIRPAPRR